MRPAVPHTLQKQVTGRRREQQQLLLRAAVLQRLQQNYYLVSHYRCAVRLPARARAAAIRMLLSAMPASWNCAFAEASRSGEVLRDFPTKSPLLRPRLAAPCRKHRFTGQVASRALQSRWMGNLCVRSDETKTSRPGTPEAARGAQYAEQVAGTANGRRQAGSCHRFLPSAHGGNCLTE